MAQATRYGRTFQWLRKESSTASRRLPLERVAAIFALRGLIPAPVHGTCFTVRAPMAELPGAVKRGYQAMCRAITTSHPRVSVCPMGTISRWLLMIAGAHNLPGAKLAAMQALATSGLRTTE